MNRENPTLDGSNVDRSMARLPVLFLVLGWRVLGFWSVHSSFITHFQFEVWVDDSALLILPSLWLPLFLAIANCNASSWHSREGEFISHSWQAKLQIPRFVAVLQAPPASFPLFALAVLTT